MGDREKAEIIPFIQAKFAPFTTSTYVRNIIGQPKSAFNFGEAMQQKKIILCKLAKGLVGEENSKLIGKMVAMQIKQAALKRASMEPKDRVPFFLYVDEFQNYVSQSFESILSEARKYKLGMTIAHQYMDQLKQK
jgi:type IV secretory pathway TraG/TraD family ATPase VirD4